MLEAQLRRLESNRLGFHVVNLAYASLWAGCAFFRLHSLPATLRRCLSWEAPAIADALLTFNFLLLVVLHTTRRRASATSRDWGDVLLANLGTWFPFFFFGAYARGDRAPGPIVGELVGPLLGVLAIGAALQTAGLISLGRSWGITPANRGIRTRGMYRFVRHPIYAGYVAFYLGYTAVAANALNAAVCFVTILILHARACREEAVLRQDAAYAAYASRVRARFIPWVL